MAPAPPVGRAAPSAVRVPPAYGFTLVEVMVVILILGLLAALVVPNVVERGDQAREQVARTNVMTIATAVKGYRAEAGRLPANLAALTEKDAAGRRPLEELPQDPWGNDYRLLECEGEPGWEVRSAGPDGHEGTDDDISNRRAP
ncbi:MAG: type II secretion system major pseudopilin GspG [Planctomycetes bacterium]|nr:type II secretion system major pseudopilin GspG [Planctomycetota bacterium]